MQINSVLAGIAVSDMERATDWYARFFGREADAAPMPILTEWHTPAVVQLVQDDQRAGHSVLTLEVADARRALAELADRGGPQVELDTTTSKHVLLATIKDPDGNAITVVEQRGSAA